MSTMSLTFALILPNRAAVDVEFVRFVCPFCDQPFGPRVLEWFTDLPTTTPDTLPRLIAGLWAATPHTPRPTNSQGRAVTGKKLLTLQEQVCDQHRYESMILPLSVQFGWPRNVNFYRLLGLLFHKSVEDRVTRVFEYPWSGQMIRKLHPSDTSREIGALLGHASRRRMLSAG